MGAIHIPSAMQQMDGFFGCKVVVTDQVRGKEIFLQVSFIKKNFIEWVRDFFFQDEHKLKTGTETMYALSQIKNEVKGTDDGEFEALIKKYEANRDLIDFKEIRRTLQSSLQMKFPPAVYSRPAFGKAGFEGQTTENTEDLKKLYVQNIRRASCLETNIEIFRDGESGGVTDSNLTSLAAAFNEVPATEAENIEICETNFSIRKRFENILKTTAPIIQNTQKIRDQSRGPLLLQSDALADNKKTIEKFDDKAKREKRVNDDMDWYGEVNLYESTDPTLAPMSKAVTTPVEEKFPEEVEPFFDEPTLDRSMEKDQGSDKEKWLDIYDVMLRTERFVEGGIAKIICDAEGKITDGNVEAFCETLLGVSKHGKMPESIIGGNERIDNNVYLTLFEKNIECAKKAKASLPYFVKIRVELESLLVD